MKYDADELKRARDEFVIAAQWCNDILSGERKPTRANIESCLHSADRTAGEGIRRLSHVLPDEPPKRDLFRTKRLPNSLAKMIHLERLADDAHIRAIDRKAAKGL